MEYILVQESVQMLTIVNQQKLPAHNLNPSQTCQCIKTRETN